MLEQQPPSQPVTVQPEVKVSTEEAIVLKQIAETLKSINGKLGFFVFLAIVTIVINILF